MKTNKILLSVAVAGVMLSACNDLNQVPYANYVTEDQKKQVVADNPEMASASVNALPQMSNTYLALFRGNPRVDTDFGVPSIMMMMDQRGMDMVSQLNDYQWYTAALEMSDFGGRYYNNIIFWRTFYNMVSSSNAVLSLIPGDTTNPESQYFRAQALGFRAWAYSWLGQMYQFTYARNPQAPTVPLILDTNLDEAAQNGMERASGEVLYNQVLADCNEAISLLDQAKLGGMTRATVAGGNLEKTFINQTVLYGLKARVDLLKQDYVAAENDASEAIRLATADGHRCYTMDEAAKPGINKISDPSFIWGFYVDPSSSLVGLIGWGGQMIPWHPNGYPGAGCYRLINKALYAKISSVDVRKGWWLNENAQPGSGMPSQYRDYINPANAEGYGIEPVPAYCGVKFGAYNDEPGATVNAEDIPYMRMEELYLMLAEAQGMRSPAIGAKTLTDFVKANRMPTYSCNASTTDAFRDELWFQRRIELWGEGFSYFDMMRFEKTLDRRGGGYDPTLVYVVDPSNPVLIYDMEYQEAENNPKIGIKTNGATKPSAVPDIE